MVAHWLLGWRLGSSPKIHHIYCFTSKKRWKRMKKRFWKEIWNRSILKVLWEPLKMAKRVVV
nr:MAG TPA: hypothetical protein [Crassvirales sp.]